MEVVTCVIGLADESYSAPTFESGGRKTDGLFYVNDIAVIAETPELMRRLLDSCERHLIAKNHRFNTRKCETFSPEGTYQLYGTNMPSTTRFKYLGTYFSQEGIDWLLHIRTMITRAREANRLQRLWDELKNEIERVKVVH
jgi:hypothetical protein